MSMWTNTNEDFDWIRSHYETDQKYIAWLQTRVDYLEKLIGFRVGTDKRLDLRPGDSAETFLRAFKEKSVVVLEGSENLWAAQCPGSSAKDGSGFMVLQHPWKVLDVVPNVDEHTKYRAVFGCEACRSKLHYDIPSWFTERSPTYRIEILPPS